MMSSENPAQKGRPAVFLDRDGTLIEDRGDLSRPADVVLFPDAIPALRRLAEQFELFIVTHQGGVGRGVLTMRDVDRIHHELLSRLQAQGVRIRRVYVCPHRRDELCECIKPKPTFLLAAAKEFGIDLRRSFTVGDHPHDVQLGRAAGATGLYVRTGHGEKHRGELSPDVVVLPGIREAAEWILADAEARRRSEDFDRDVADAAAVLLAGGLVAFPTETVYGLGAHALNPTAVARVFEVKQRPRFDPLIVHVPDWRSVPTLVTDIPPLAEQLMARFWPGPLTLVLPKAAIVPDVVTAGLPTVAVRCPRHPVAQALLRQSGVPIAAPSANRFGCLSPTTAEHVREQLGAAVGRILDAGPCSVGVESTVVAIDEEGVTLLREGGVPREELEALAGPIRCAQGDRSRPSSPGQLPRHYAPETPLRLWDEATAAQLRGRIGLLAFREPVPEGPWSAVEILSTEGDLREAAATLFAKLRALDAMNLDWIVAQPAPEVGLGRAINDRLRRAACDREGCDTPPAALQESGNP
jgi:L-threonylcarbamoyladenylate synthase